jgi:hypothetical protein
MDPATNQQRQKLVLEQRMNTQKEPQSDQVSLQSNKISTHHHLPGQELRHKVNAKPLQQGKHHINPFGVNKE